MHKALKFISRTFILLVIAAFSSCASLPAYELPAGTPSVKIGTHPLSEICSSGKKLRLNTDKKGYATIPAGERVFIGSEKFDSDGSIHYSCNRWISFIPEKGKTYYYKIDLYKAFAKTYCFANVYAEDARSKLEKIPDAIKIPARVSAKKDFCTTPSIEFNLDESTEDITFDAKDTDNKLQE